MQNLEWAPGMSMFNDEFIIMAETILTTPSGSLYLYSYSTMDLCMTLSNAFSKWKKIVAHLEKCT
uniref:Uncharacterized protein n=1 Tax=Lepeophtheirus salmonis TaxID=72036 RepID=A0A0K2THS2_LEPSM